MSGAWVDLLIVFGLVAINALLSGSEMALVSLREPQLNELESAGRRGRRVAELARSPSRYLAALQLGITLAGFLASASAAVELSESVAPALGFLGGSARAASVVVVTVLVSLVTIVLGELVPKRIAMLHSERWSLMAVVPLTWFMNLVRPVLALLEILTETIVRITGNASDPDEVEISDAEFLRLTRARSSFDPLQAQIITEAVAIGDRTLRHILVPRPHVISIEAETEAAEALEHLRAHGLSKAPLVDRDLDHPIGQVHVLDLVNAEGPVRPLAHPVLALPETLPALGALRRLQASSTKLAVVVDEHGGTSGIVTFEDLVEELVGEVEDEADQVGPQTVIDGIRGEVIVLPGTFPIHRMDEVGVALPAGEYVTIAGLVLQELGRIPDVGEAVDVDGSLVTVTGTDRTSITSVELRPSADALIRPGSPDTE